jgi:hypothetical protein
MTIDLPPEAQPARPHVGLSGWVRGRSGETIPMFSGPTYRTGPHSTITYSEARADAIRGAGIFRRFIRLDLVRDGG